MGTARTVGHVRRLGLTPLKGSAHEHPERLELLEHGPGGDRGWCLLERDEDGRAVVARTVRTPALLRVRASQRPGGGLRLGLPDAVHTVPEPPGDPSVPPVVADYWGRPAPVEPVPGPWDADLSALVGRPVALARVRRPGAVVYAEPVVLVTTSSLRELGRRTGGAVDDERFRSPVLVATGGAPPFVEDSWHGHVLRVGSALLEVVGGVGRCAVVQRAPGTGEPVPDDLVGALAADRVVDGPAGRRVDLGVGARVLHPGAVRLGDAVALEP